MFNHTFIISIFSIMMFVIILLSIALRGALNSTKIDTNFKPHPLTGREREAIRRKVVNLGQRGVSVDDVLNLLYTFRLIELGQYTDEDIYVPDDSYEDI